MFGKIFLPALLFLAMGCAPVQAVDLSYPASTDVSYPAPTQESGVQGQALIGPTCPVVKVGEDCQDKPYATALAILAINGDEITRFQTGEDGSFKIALPPGDYTLHPISSTARPGQRTLDLPFTVSPGQFTSVTISFDSGIR